MSNSSLVDCKVLSPNHSGKRTKALCRITPHCVVGQLTAESIGGCFPKGRQASCNYGIGTDGRVVLVVDEGNRSWCSSSNDNDQQAVTIECASDKSEPYAMNSKVYDKLIKLCVDICKRNGKKKLLWLGSKDKTLSYKPKSDEMVLTAHRWFANKSCPGEWLYSRYGELAKKVTELLGGKTESAGGTGGKTETKKPAAKSYQVRVKVADLNIRKKPTIDSASAGYTGKGVFTIVEEATGKISKDGKTGKWGKLKSGAGWICLAFDKYTEKK